MAKLTKGVKKVISFSRVNPFSAQMRLLGSSGPTFCQIKV
jgi:hypothetical protein